MKKKIAVITCYHDPDYIRSRTLRAVFRAQPDVTVYEVKNNHKGMLRYPEVLWKIWQLKRHTNPDAYLLTFRGQELLPFVRLLVHGSPLWFDEFVPPAYALIEPYRRSLKKAVRKTIVRLGQPLYRFALRRCEFVLADTTANAEFGARRSHINLSSYLVLPVGADEKLFVPKKTKKREPFQVFYYSTDMQPLHGIPTVLGAAVMLQHDPLQFVLVGGKKPMKKAVKQTQKLGANIRYEAWVPFDELSVTMRESQLSLGGPFGGTRQADQVVTGKTYQSLACGVVTVIGNGAATEKLFVDKQNCLKVRQADTTALAAAIRWAVRNTEELPRIAAAGRELYEKEFSNAVLIRLVRPLVDSLSP